jgi:hypothetical protein
MVLGLASVTVNVAFTVPEFPSSTVALEIESQTGATRYPCSTLCRLSCLPESSRIAGVSIAVTCVDNVLRDHGGQAF